MDLARCAPISLSNPISRYFIPFFTYDFEEFIVTTTYDFEEFPLTINENFDIIHLKQRI